MIGFHRRNAMHASSFFVLLAGTFLTLQCLGLVSAASAAANIAPERVSNVAAARAPDLAHVTDLIVHRTNELRASQNVASTEMNMQLARAAQGFAEFMARSDQHGHEVDGSTPAARAKQRGYNFCMVSENIGFQFDSAGFAADELARRFVDGWRNSPGHRKNMLDPDAMEIGAAVARSTRTGRYYAVQMFGRPQSAQFAFEIANEAGASVHYRLGTRTFELPPRAIRTHQQCRSVELVLQVGRADGQTSAQPRSGERFAVVRDDSGLRLSRR
jgi:uncharacterized protein YkwD